MRESMDFHEHGQTCKVLAELEDEEAKLYEERAQLVRERNTDGSNKDTLEGKINLLDRRIEVVETESQRIKWKLRGEQLTDGGPTAFNMPKRFPEGEEPKTPEELYRDLQ